MGYGKSGIADGHPGELPARHGMAVNAAITIDTIRIAHA
jgi:hypothetical protein